MGSAVDRILSEGQPGPVVPQQGTPSKVDSILTARPSVDDILGGSDVPFDPNRLAPREVPVPDNADQHGLLRRLGEILKEQGLSLVQFGKYSITSGPSIGGVQNFAFSPGMQRDAALASQGDKEAELRYKRGLNGAALAASTIAGEGALAGIPKGATLLPRFARWFAAQEAGAATYGAIQPLEDDETRAQVIKDDLIQFPIAGAVLHGIFKGTGKLFKGFFGVDPAVESELKNMGKEEAEKVAKMTVKIVNEAGDVPPGAEPAVHGAALNEATKRIVGERRPTTVTARVVGEPPTPSGPDFTVEGNPPPEAPPATPATTPPKPPTAPTVVSKNSLEPISEQQFQQELDAITPKPPAGLDEEAAARARVEAARTTPFPGTDIPSGITEPLGLSVVRDKSGNLKRVYHGTGTPFNQFDPNKLDKYALYGQGIYFTEDPKVASGYAVNRDADTPLYRQLKAQLDRALANDDVSKIKFLRDKLDELASEGANVIPAYLDIRNPLDIEAHYKYQGEVKTLLDAVGVKYPELKYQGFTGQQLYDYAASFNPENPGEVLREAGFDGITHVSGERTPPHQVYITFSPDQVHTPWNIELQRVLGEAQQNPGPVANGAVADAVSDAVVAETSPLEIMDEVTKQNAVKAVESPSNYDVIVNKAVEEGLVDRATLENPDSAKVLAKLVKSFEGEPENTLGDIGQLDSDPGTGPEAKQAWSTLNEEQLGSLRDLVEKFFASESGAISARAATRIAALSLSGVSFYAAEQQDDPQARALLNTVGGILAVGALVPGSATKQWLKDSNFGYWLIKGIDIGRVASNGTKEGMHTWQGLTSQGRAMAKMLERRLRPVFPDQLSKDAAMFALDEGPSAPEWVTLSKDQQKEVISQSILNNQMGRILVQLGIIPNARMHYVRHMFQDLKTQNLWYSTWEALGKSGGFAKQRQFETLREAIKWAKANNLPGPVMDPAVAQPFHMIEVSKARANKKLQDQYEKLGLLVDYDPQAIAASANKSPGSQLRQVRIPNLGGAKMAPDDAATVLERAAAGAQKFGLDHEYLTALDQARGQIMRSIMFWAWEHGINVARAAYALDGTGSMYRNALQKVRNADPVVMQVAKYADLFRRPDFGPEGQGLFERVLHKVGQNAPTLKKIGVGFEDFRAKGERRLWDEMVPALGIAAWTREMHKWTERTGGKYLLGSPEYEAAARQAGKFASTAMGKVPELVTSPAVAFGLRQILFSPNWTRTRISLTAHAAGEIQKIASGEINPNEATYLGYKLRSVLVAAAGTIIFSYLLTGRKPTFNPNTQKYYVNTGIKDDRGREMGVDLTGWWQDDLKVFNDPWAYLRDRQSPMLRIAGTQLSGRDVFGRPITGAERLENIVQSIGPGGELVSSAASALSGEFGGAEALKAASGVAAVGNVSSLPRESDAIVSKMAAKLLRQAGLPDDRDRVYTLGQLMRQNFTQSGTLYGGEVNTWLAYQRRAYTKRGIPWLWQEGKKVLRDLAK